MNGVKFGTYHSYDDMSLLLIEKVIGNAPIKEKTVKVEGGHGVLDYTEYFGEPKYDRRTLSFVFKSIINQTQFLMQYSEIQNAIHGRRLKIILDEDPDYYYIGRIEVGEWKKDKNVGEVTIKADCEPWKYKKNTTIVTQTVNGSAILLLTNQRKRAVPTITATADMSFSFNGTVTAAQAGTFIIPTLELVEGSNSVTVSGTGIVTFEYQEGGL